MILVGFLDTSWGLPELGELVEAVRSYHLLPTCLNKMQDPQWQVRDVHLKSSQDLEAVRPLGGLYESGKSCLLL